MSKVDIVDIFTKRTRHPFRPRSSDIITGLFPNFEYFETPSTSLVAGTCSYMGKKMVVIGQQKPKPEDLKCSDDLKKLNYGMLTAEDHSFILTLLKNAQNDDPENTIIFCMIDTYGADISMASAQQFQAFFIARLIQQFLTIPIRTVSLVLGEGGSGGALAIQVTDIRGQMDDALYATAPPESMAAIVFRDATRIRDALTILKPTAKDLRNLNVIDTIVPSPAAITNIKETTENIRLFLEKAVKDLSRVRIKKLIKKREERVKKYGVNKKTGPLHDIRRYIEKPIRRTFRKPPPEIKVVNPIGAMQVSDDYGNFVHDSTGEDLVECAEKKGGCGKLIPLKALLDNSNVCPECGHSYTIGASGWIDCLADTGTFHELYRNLSVDQLLEEAAVTNYYRDFLAKQEGKSLFKESLVVGTARVNTFQVVMAISGFNYSGGSMGVVFGEKFRRAVDFAIQEHVPLISLCCSGGARLYEGISALMQMAKTIESVNRLKKHGLPYISILSDPSTGGAIASYAALGDIVIAEPRALVIFTGPRVMKSLGFEVEEKLIRSDSLHEISKDIYKQQDFFHEIRGIQEVCERKDMKACLTKYLDFYARTSYRPKNKQRKKIKKSIRP